MQLFLEAEKNSSEPPAAPLQGRFPVDSWHLCVSVEGTPEVCDRASREFDRLATSPDAKHAQLAALSESEGADLWHYLGQSIPLLLETSAFAAIFKISTLPSRLVLLLDQLRVLADQASLPQAVLARACGIIYFALLPSADDSTSMFRLSEAAAAVFSLCAAENASASLPWCPTALKRSVNTWGLPRSGFALMRRLKSAFDPQNVFAPGRFLSP